MLSVFVEQIRKRHHSYGKKCQEAATQKSAFAPYDDESREAPVVYLPCCPMIAKFICGDIIHRWLVQYKSVVGLHRYLRYICMPKRGNAAGGTLVYVQYMIYYGYHLVEKKPTAENAS